MSSNISIRLKRANKIYHEGEIIVGVVVVESSTDLRHDGLSLAMEGCVNLQLSNKNVGIFETFSNGIKPITLVNTAMELAPVGKIPAGVTEIPFEMPLQVRQPVSAAYPGLLETYHGVFISVMYTLKCSMKRSFLNKPLNTSCQFFVQHKEQSDVSARPARCSVSPGSLRAARSSALPHFHLYAEIDSTICPLSKPITGMVRMEESSLGVKSLELQLVRVETVATAAGHVRDATEVQNIQVASEMRAGRAVPLQLLLPRLFTCPTTATHCFKIEFELNIAVIFEDDHLVTENFPILLVR